MTVTPHIILVLVALACLLILAFEPCFRARLRPNLWALAAFCLVAAFVLAPA